MFKLFERDKCRSLALDITDSGRTAIVPGTLLFDDPSKDGAVALTNQTITMATAGLFYVSVDYYANTHNSMIGDQVDYSLDNAATQMYVGSDQIAAVPVVENFDAEIMGPDNLVKGSLLTIKGGKWDDAAEGDVVIAMATEANATTGTTVPAKITTRIAPYLWASEE